MPAIFTEAGAQTASRGGHRRRTGARVVEIDTRRLPADGSYATFVRDIATRVADGLGGGA